MMKFTKMAGCGNDFIVVTADALPAGIEPSALAETLCRTGTGIGADGLVIIGQVSAGKAADYQVTMVNRSGLPAEMCGNAVRCVARYAHDHKLAGPHHTFLTASGPIEADVHADHVKVTLPVPSNFKRDLTVSVPGSTWKVDAMDIGVPHAVLWWEGDIETAPVDTLGRAMRHAAEFPRGTNVNFVAMIEGRLRLRTFERGVEAETLACGTGSSAAAISAAMRGIAKPPVKVITTEGGILTIDFHITGEAISNLTLAGPADYVFHGTLPDTWLSRFVPMPPL